jgi:hypothetical protein
MLKTLKSKLTGGTVEAKIAGLRTTKATLEARIPVLEAEKAAALGRRRDALITDPTGAAASEAAQAARDAESNLADVADALQAVEQRIAEAVEQVEADRARAEREAAAAELESDAAKVAAAAAAMAEAVEAVAKAHARMMLAVSSRAAPQIMDHREHLSPVQFADGVLLQAIVAALPEIDFGSEVFPGPYTRVKRVEGRDAKEAGQDAAEMLRTAAARVRAEELPANLPEWRGRGPKIRVSEPDDVPVFPVKCFSWIDRHGQLRRATPRDSYVPRPVSAAALAAGAARRAGGDETATAQLEWDRRCERVAPDAWFDGIEVVDLGVNLQEEAEAEAQRQRAEWEAAEAEKRAELERRAA